MSPLHAPPFLQQVSENPLHDFGTQPDDVEGGVVAAGSFAFGVCGARDVDDVDEGVGVAEVVEEFVAEAFAFVGAGDEAGDVEELDGDGAAAVKAGAVVGFAAGGDVVAGAGTVDLEVADGTLGVDGCEAMRAQYLFILCSLYVCVCVWFLTESYLRKYL